MLIHYNVSKNISRIIYMFLVLLFNYNNNIKNTTYNIIKLKIILKTKVLKIRKKYFIITTFSMSRQCKINHMLILFLYSIMYFHCYLDFSEFTEVFVRNPFWWLWNKALLKTSYFKSNVPQKHLQWERILSIHLAFLNIDLYSWIFRKLSTTYLQ